MSKHIISVALAASFLVIVNVRADVVTLWGKRAGTSNYQTLHIDTSVQVGNHNYTNDLTPEPFLGGTHYTDTSFLFVLDLHDCPVNGMHPGTAFAYFQTLQPDGGVVYNQTTSLANSQAVALDPTKKDAIQTLVNHVYAPMLNAYATDFELYDAYSLAFQAAIWEIVRGDSETWNVGGNNPNNYTGTTGFVITDVTGGDYLGDVAGANAMFRELINGWLDSLETSIWDERFASSSSWDITVYSGDDYKSFFAITGGGDSNVVPEPATIAVLGLGLAGLGWTRMRRKK